MTTINKSPVAHHSSSERNKELPKDNKGFVKALLFEALAEDLADPRQIGDRLLAHRFRDEVSVFLTG